MSEKSVAWSCVVEVNQVWLGPTRKSFRVVSVVKLPGEPVRATVVLEPIHGGERETAGASLMCQGDSGWTRLPDPPPLSALPRAFDPEEGQTECFEKTMVGLAPK